MNFSTPNVSVVAMTVSTDLWLSMGYYILLISESLERDDPNSPWIRVCSIRVFPNFPCMPCEDGKPQNSKCPFLIEDVMLTCLVIEKGPHKSQSDKELVAQGDELPEERCMQQFYNPLCRCRGYNSGFNVSILSGQLLQKNKTKITNL